ncbi:MAG: histidine phosphatase family protein [Myxococcales bacterium]|nr:histidine phosphatase family protein [Myxococcales bacterium]
MQLGSAVILLGALAIVGCGAPATSDAPARPPAALASAPACASAPAVVVLVRHAEKASEEGDPDLSDAGRARAARFARLFARSSPTHLFASDARRTQATLAPLAQATGRAVIVRPAKATNALGEELRALEPGSLAVVAHHSNGLPTLARALGVELSGVHEGAIAHDAYGRVFVVVLGCGDRPPRLVELGTDEPSASAPAAR